MVKSHHNNPIRTFFLNLKPIVSYLLERLGEGNGNPLQCSCLENPRDGVAQSRTQLKWLSSSRAVIGFPGGSAVKNRPASANDLGSIPGSGRSPGGGNGNPLQYSCLGTPIDRETCQATVRGVATSRTQLNNNRVVISQFFRTKQGRCNV